MAGIELAKAFVQIVPSARGITGSIKSALAPEASSAGTAAGQSIGTNLIGKVKGLIAAAGIGTAIKSSLDAGGAIQQSFGGLDTLYDKASGAAKNYAQEAYKAGINANDYAEQAVSFGASLKAAFEGDTTKAVKAANTAIMDMTDNAAKMGTPLENIQNAYQGFAKQNYTMLDNLKLGYGGTKSEMERLLSDAEKLSGKKYDIGNLGDVYDAIHVIQEDLGLTGVAAEEASQTFTGSFGAMKAAASNFMASLSAEEMDVGPQMSALVETTSTFFFGNFLPMVGRIAASIPEAVGTLITTAGPIISEKANGLLENVVTFFQGDGLAQMTSAGMDIIGGFLNGFNESSPQILQKGAEIVQTVAGGILENLPAMAESALGVATNFVLGIAENIPTFMQTGYELVSNLVSGVLQAAPQLITTGFTAATNLVSGILPMLPSIMTTGFTMISSLARGVISNIPAIISAAAQGVARFVAAVGQNLPQILSTGIQLLGKLVAGIIQAIPQIPGAVSRIISTIRQGFTGIDWGSIGRNIISGIASGITGAVGSIVSAAKGAAQSALQAAKNLLGIHSPSRVFRDQVGYQIIAGWTEGITENRNKVLEAVTGIAEESYRIPNGEINSFVKSDRSVRAGSTNERVLSLLEIIASKETSLVIGNKEFKRTLDDFGVAYA